MGTSQFAFARTLPGKWASSDSLAGVAVQRSDGGNSRLAGSDDHRMDNQNPRRSAPRPQPQHEAAPKPQSKPEEKPKQ